MPEKDYVMLIRTSHLLLIPALTASLLLTATAATAQQVVPPSPVSAPVQSEARAQALLLNAKTVAVVDLGVDANFPPGDTNGVRMFTNVLASWGRYQIVAPGQKADVTLQVEGLTRTGWVSATDDSAGYTTYNPYYRLSVIDPATGDSLWDIAAPVITGKPALFQMSVRNLLSAVKTFEGVPLTKQELKDARYLDHERAKGGWLIAGLVVALVGGAVVGGIEMHNAFDNSVNAQKQSGIQWCINNHVSMAQCPANY